jgi:hypothetical protein
MAEFAGPALQFDSQVIGAFSSYYQGKAAAGVDEENARRAQLTGAYQEEAIRAKGRAVSGEAIAALAGNGVSVGSGSASDLLFQSNLAMEQDALTARYNAGSEAASLRTQAGQKRAAARGALVGGLLRAGASALSGMDQVTGSDAAMQAAAIEREARFPGAQALPIPQHLINAPYYRGGQYNNGFFGGY